MAAPAAFWALKRHAAFFFNVFALPNAKRPLGFSSQIQHKFLMPCMCMFQKINAFQECLIPGFQRMHAFVPGAHAFCSWAKDSVACTVREQIRPTHQNSNTACAAKGNKMFPKLMGWLARHRSVSPVSLDQFCRLAASVHHVPRPWVPQSSCQRQP